MPDVLRRFGLNVLTLVIGGALVFGIFTFGDRQGKLCKVIYTQVAKGRAELGKPGSAGYSYYRDHPDELKRGREQADDLLRGLAYCKSDDLKAAPRKITPKPPAERQDKSPARGSSQPRTPRTVTGPEAALPIPRPQMRPQNRKRESDPMRERPPPPVARINPPNGPPPGPAAPAGPAGPEHGRHGHERSVVEGVCDLIDGLLINGC